MCAGRTRSCWWIAAALLPAAEASARPPAYDIPAGALGPSIEQLASQSGASIGTEGALPDVRTHAVHAATTVDVALARMLAGTGWSARRVGPATWRIVPSPRRRLASPPAIAAAEITVTAAKRPLTLADAPYAIALVRPGPGSTDPAAGTATIAANAEGLTLTDFGPGRNRMFLRGVADSPFDGTSQSTVALLLDEARVTYTAPDPDLRLVDVDRVELLKGPQGSLYGVGTLGGIYHIVTRRAATDTTSGSASLGVSAIAGGGVGTSGSAVANLVLRPDAVAVRLVAYATDAPGWVDTGTRRDSNSSHVEGVRGDLGVESGGWRFDLAGMLQRLNTADTQYVYAPRARTRPAQLPEPHDNDFNDIAARASGALGAATVQASLSYVWHEVDDVADATVGAESFGLSSPQTFTDNRAYRVFDAEVRLTGRLWRFTWLAGIEHLAAQETEARGLSSGAMALMIDNAHQSEADTGVFTDLTLPLTARFSIEGGARLYDSTFSAESTAAVASAKTRDARFGITPSFAVIWHPSAGAIGWLRYGAAYRQGGVDASATTPRDQFRGDEVSTFEAGWRSGLPGGGRIDADAYLTLWDDLQADMLQPNGLIATENAGEARIFGIEATVSQPIATGLHAEVGATAQSALLIRNDLGIRLDDLRLPVVPSYTLRGAIAHDLRIGDARGTIRFGMHETGPSRLSFDPALDRRMGHILDSDFAASLTQGRMRIDLRVDNLFNRAGDIFAFGNTFRASIAQYTPQPPRRISLSLTRNF